MSPFMDDDDPQDAELGEDEVDDEPEHGTHKITHRRRRQQAIFNDWYQREAATTDFSKVRRSAKPSDGPEMESIKDLLRNTSGKKIMGSEHEFQIALFERAKERNTIAVADTGSGKTLIAMNLLKWTLEQEINARAAGKPRKIALFLVDKVTLMFQQYSAFKSELAFTIECVSGKYNRSDLWSRSKWIELLHKADVLVCTAEVLHQALMRSFVRMELINLLIFDEAHHAKKGHPYARIMKDYYAQMAPGVARPRIFGMTASPIDLQDETDIEDCARELETILDARIATYPEELMQDRSQKAEEEVRSYWRAPRHPRTALYHALHDKYRNLQHFNVLFDRANDIRTELGCWCSDAFWQFAFTEAESKKWVIRAERRQAKEHESEEYRQKFNREVKDLQEAQQLIEKHQLRQPTTNFDDITPRVKALWNILMEYFERKSDSHCLAFVERRETARLLHLLMKRLDIPYLKSDILVGSTSRDFEGDRLSFTQQIKTTKRFRAEDDLNCLFATSVAEEGLDIRSCNVVVRFDPCKTMIQYIQSRGRARHQNSRFIHIIDANDQRASDALHEHGQSEDRMKNHCKTILEDRQLFEEDDFEEPDPDLKPWSVPGGNAVLQYHASIGILNSYVDTITHDEEDDMDVRYVMFARDGKFVCEVSLPERAGLSAIIGRPFPKKVTAKSSAAFEACKSLVRQGMLDNNLTPFREKRMHHMRNARLALKCKKQRTYDVQRKPTLWQSGRGSIQSKLYLTVLQLADRWDRPTRPLGLFTRHKLPTLPSFPLVRMDGIPVAVETIMAEVETNMDEQTFSQLTWFTLTIFKDIYNKKFEDAPQDMSYWLAPLKGLVTSARSDAVDWSLLHEMHRKEPLKWNREMSNAELLNKFVLDPWDGGRRFFSEAIEPSLGPFDEIPKDVAPGPRGAENIIGYSSSLFKKSHARRTWDEQQPVFVAEKVIHRLNVLAAPHEAEQNAVTRSLLCAEPLDYSRLPPEVATMGLLFPSIIHRIESYLIALDFVNVLGLDVQSHRALEAITKDSDNSDDAQAEQINFQRGMGPNYERLEFIGDTFLKMATSLSTYIINAKKNESWMHDERMILLCNDNMFHNAQHHGYAKYVRSEAFSRRTWYPEGLKLLQGKGANKVDGGDPPQQALSDKTIADVCEAMIGAALVSHVVTGYENLSCFDNAVKAVTAFVESKEHAAHNMMAWADYYKRYRKPTWQKAACAASELHRAEEMQQIHKYKFKYIKLLTSALTHPSLPSSYSKAPSYQRLEFLGDSLLDMASVKHLFYTYQHKDPQWMTEHKMAMVSNKFMGALGAKLGLGKMIYQQSPMVRKQILTYMEEFEEAQREAGSSRGFWQTLKEPPKCLADVVESYVGAIFVDSKFNFAEVQRFFDTHIKWFFEDMSIYDSFANNHPINRLRDFIETSMGCQNWRLMAKDQVSDDEYTTIVLAAVLIHDNVVGKGAAKSIRPAKSLAANDAFEQLNGLAPVVLRGRVGCDCVLKDAEMKELEGAFEDTAI